MGAINPKMLALACLFALLSVSFAQHPVKPDLTDEFSASVNFHIKRGKQHPREINGMWYHDHAGKREALDGHQNLLGQVQLFKNWNSTRGGKEYENIVEHKKCFKRDFQQKLHGAFDFVAHSHYAGKCDGANGARWTATMPGAFELDLCASIDGKTPYWLERKHLVEDHLHIVARFRSFVPGKPSD